MAYILSDTYMVWRILSWFDTDPFHLKLLELLHQHRGKIGLSLYCIYSETNENAGRYITKYAKDYDEYDNKINHKKHRTYCKQIWWWRGWR